MAPPLFSPLPSLPPPSLKPLTPFIRHHRELSTADPVISYWCLYLAAQQGISTPRLPKEGKDYLLEMMDKLEEIKAALSSNDAATSDAAGSAYVENFALDVFNKADNEDRAGKANKDTARAFQAAANFLELLGLFTGEGAGMSEEINAKRVYAKWKTAEILKALRESRKPAPGPPGWDPEQERKEKEEEQEAAKAVEQAGEDDEVLAREIAKLTGADEQPGGGDVGDDAAIARALSPDGVAGSHISRRSPARLSLDATAALDQASSPPLMQRSTSASSSSVHSPPLGGAASPNFSHPLRPQLERGLTGSSSASSIAAQQGQQGQHPHLMPPSNAAARTSPIPGQVTVPGRPLPVPPNAGGSPSAPPQQPYGQPTSPRPSAPPLPTPPPPRIPSPAAAAPAPIAPPTSSLPDALSARQTSAAQRYAKYAISALDFDDLETARRNLRLALDVCEGREAGDAK